MYMYIHVYTHCVCDMVQMCVEYETGLSGQYMFYTCAKQLSTSLLFDKALRYMYIVFTPLNILLLPTEVCPPHTVDIRRVVLPGGASVAVVVRAGEPYLLKVELSSILPSHSRDVLETIRRVSIFLLVPAQFLALSPGYH